MVNNHSTIFPTFGDPMKKIRHFYSKYANPLILLLGYFNDLKIKDICETCKLKQVVKVLTRKDATIDLVMMNMDNNMYSDPVTLPSIRSSDHLCVLLRPNDRIKTKIKKEKVMTRKFTRSAIIQFGAWDNNI